MGHDLGRHVLKCGEHLFLKNDILKNKCPKGQFFMKMTKNDDFFEKLSKKERARTTAATTATTTEEFSQSIQVHPPRIQGQHIP